MQGSGAPMGGALRISPAPIGAYGSPIGAPVRRRARIAASDHSLGQQHRQGAAMSNKYRNPLVAAATLGPLLTPERLSSPARIDSLWKRRRVNKVRQWAKEESWRQSRGRAA